MLGCWMLVSPFVFQHRDSLLWYMDWIAATLVIGLSLLSYWHPLRYSHLVTVLVASGMVAFGRIAAGAEVGPGYQNHIVVGLLLLMFAIIPNHASRPPAGWAGEVRETVQKPQQ
jgi:hypothetical protein